jgi:hypothetical protein
MLNGNMILGVVGDKLMVRIPKEDHALCLELPHTAEMDFTGSAMAGFLYVYPEGTADDRELREWVARCASYARALPAKNGKTRGARTSAKANKGRAVRAAKPTKVRRAHA